MSKVDCPICTYKQVESNSSHDGSAYICPRCGPYRITRNAYEDYSHKLPNPKLSARVRELNEGGSPNPLLASAELTSIIENLPNYSVPQKQLILLRAIERLTKDPGEPITITLETDYSLAWAGSDNEIMYLIKELKNRGLLEELYGGSDYVDCRLTTLGWEYLEEHDTHPAFSNQVFVAMRFVNDMEAVWKDGIKPAIEDAGYDPYRVDKDEHNDRIDDKIITEIKNSKFLIADVTHQNQGVYFEAGFAQGLNRPVIWCVKKSDLKFVHLDTRQFNHIVWEMPDDLKEKLYYRICATIGKSEGKTVR